MNFIHKIGDFFFTQLNACEGPQMLEWSCLYREKTDNKDVFSV